jgi:hypothetical protein
VQLISGFLFREKTNKAGGDMQRHGRSSWVMVYTLFIVGVLPLLIGGCGSKQSSPTFNITGGWNMFYATKGTQGEAGPSLFTFSVTNGNLNGGTAQGQGITGTVDGLNISFTFVDSDGATNTSTGTISADDGSTMSGTWTKGNLSGTWHGVINLAPPMSVAGNWNVFQTASGGTEQGLGVFAFTQSFNNAAQTNSNIGGTTPDGKQITGAIGRMDITFFWTDGGGVTHTLTGIITSDGTTISGTWYDTSGNSGTWRAAKS